MAIQMSTGDSAPGWCCGGAGSNQVLAERVEVAGVNLKVVNHTRGGQPFVNVIDTAGHTVEFACQYLSDTQFVISFNFPFPGQLSTCNG
jgi:hypothetical protein